MSDITCPVCKSPVSAQDAVCPACGFKLFGSTQRFSPLDLTNEAVCSAAPAMPYKAMLRIVHGPQIGTIFNLEGKPITIGRSPECDIFLNDMTVSRQHATIQSTSDGYTIVDTNSFNGIWINNVNVNDASLKEGDIVQIGAFCLIYEEQN
ncbi:MAG: FHA domain-containing protein [Raoultibacter sp.]